jgi:FkbM family methyltransferase
MDTRLARRAVGDVRAVCRTTSPTAAGRWVASLLMNLPECARSRSLTPADQGWSRIGAKFRAPNGVIISLPAVYTPGAREMYCRDVYLRTGLTMPSAGWVLDLGANHGLFSVWAAVSGAQVVAVEAQHGFAAEIQDLAEHNGVTERVHVEIAMASGAIASGSAVGALADDHLWAASSHSGTTRPGDVSIPQLMAAYRIDRIGLLKMDIEGGEFAVLAEDEDLSWLRLVDQLVIEVHRGHGDAMTLIERIQGNGFIVDLRNNDGSHLTAGNHPDYAYCRRG